MEILMPGKKLNRNRSGASVKAKNTGSHRQFNSSLVWKIMFTLVFVGALGYGVMSTPKVVETISNQRVEQVLIEGKVNYISEQEVLAAVNSFISESLLLVDMQEIKKVLETMPWIRSVTIRREWPDTLVLNIVEEKAIARWGEKRLLNQDGEIIAPDNIIGLESLAILSGPQGTERKVMEQYQLFSQLLYQRGLKIAELDLNERAAWKLTLANGVDINIGKSQLMEKMRRLVDFAKDSLIEQMDEIESIDLRYTSGIAVKTKENNMSEVVSL